MVLRQKRDNTDVLIVDASKGFIKVGKNNKLRASDIKKIADTVINREDIEKYSKKITREEIRKNDYNLNIPRYVDSSENPETWDIYASMFGGIPKSEINELKKYWEAFPNLKNEIFTDNGTPYVELAVEKIKNAIMENSDVKEFFNNYKLIFSDFGDYLKNELIENMSTINISKEESNISDNIFARLESVPLVDKYEAYQLLDDGWEKVDIDLEVIQTEGLDAAKKVDPNMVLKKKDGKEQEIQDGWKGHVIPFDLIQATLLKEETDNLKQKENRILEISSEYEQILDSLSEEEKELSVVNEGKDAFVSKEVSKELKQIYSDVESEEIRALNGYISLLDSKATKAEKEEYINNHIEVSWNNMSASKDGTYAKAAVNKYILELQYAYAFPEESFEEKLVRVSELMEEEKELKAQVKKEAEELHLLTKETIENLSDEQVLELLEIKWIKPIVSNISKLPDKIIKELVDKIEKLADKYAITYASVAEQISDGEKTLSSLIDDLTGDEFDMKGLSEFQLLLKGE
ncbi:SAM-dependent methyltransferase [Clostridium sporogenes]|nr:SAM-dependent methyltransferase [Clostridium sporogenes]KRU34187.1 SAM-dependent methyltransferase [Clostridium sporogenes]KRU41204.1 SAM-dependent methyltransferase [Clostridium sporogenes]OQP95527.1 SAM-dependent methyltransferase [Clostridium sporogenes]